jgi:hypothetical protein
MLDWEDARLHQLACYGKATHEAAGKQYCLMHAPIESKAEKFTSVLKKRLEAKKYNFRGTYFPIAANFNHHYFAEEANFSLAEFHGEVYFGNTEFSGTAHFLGARFCENVYCVETIFTKYSGFSFAVFEKEVSFTRAVFKKDAVTDFKKVHFMNSTYFMQNTVEQGAEFYFGETTFEKLNRVTFHSLKLKPRWFINADPRQLNFENVTFPSLKSNSAAAAELNKATQCIRSLGEIWFREKIEKVISLHELLTITYWRLSENAETNSRYEEASDFRKMAFEIERLGRKAQRKEWLENLGDTEKTGLSIKFFFSDLKRSTGQVWSLIKSYPFGVLQFLYRWLSGYGENWARASLVMLMIWILFAILYLLPFSTFYRWEIKAPGQQEYEMAIKERKVDMDGRPLNFAEAFSYSFGVMSLQKPEPKPLGTVTFALVALETALGPLQAALLALAIRRKFMR